MAFYYKEFADYVSNFEKAANDFDAWLIEFLKDNAEWLVGETKERTPVDTGFLRKSWRVTDVIRTGDTLEFFLINDADYSEYVELGHATVNRKSWVEGRFMARISMQELQARLPRRFDAEFAVFMAEHGVL